MYESGWHYCVLDGANETVQESEKRGRNNKKKDRYSLLLLLIHSLNERVGEGGWHFCILDAANEKVKKKKK